MTEVEDKEAEAKLVHNRLCALIRALSNTLSARDPTSFLPKVARQYLESIGEGVPPPPKIICDDEVVGKEHPETAGASDYDANNVQTVEGIADDFDSQELGRLPDWITEPIDDPDVFSDVNRSVTLSPTELLESVVRTACENDSQGVADYADALRYLASVGRCRIIVDAGNLVRVEWLG